MPGGPPPCPHLQAGASGGLARQLEQHVLLPLRPHGMVKGELLRAYHDHQKRALEPSDLCAAHHNLRGPNEARGLEGSGASPEPLLSSTVLPSASTDTHERRPNAP